MTPCRPPSGALCKTEQMCRASVGLRPYRVWGRLGFEGLGRVFVVEKLDRIPEIGISGFTV